MKTIFKELAIRQEVWESRAIVDITFIPIYELIFKGSTMRFKTYQLRQEAYNILKNGEIRTNSTFEYINSWKVYNKLKK